MAGPRGSISLLSMRRHVTKKRLTIAIIALAILAAILFVKLISGPAKGTIKTLDSNSTETRDSYIKLGGQNFSLYYLEKYQLENTGQHAANILESYRLTTAGGPKGLARILAVTVSEMPAGGLAETSAYKSRLNDPATYRRAIEQRNGQEIHFFNNQQTPETVAFLQKGNMVATVGFSGGIEAEGATAEYDHVINSWQWR